MITKLFKDWDSEDVERAFGIKRVWDMPSLLDWTKEEKGQKMEINASIEELKNKLLKNADAWNEDELKMFFIAPLLSQIPLEVDDFKPFTQRTISAKFPELDLEVSGKVEFVIARGKQRPKQPYFFLHEYKQERRRENDPLGQLLIAMVAARQNNEKKTSLFGCFVVGRDWFFVVLDKQEYAVSLSYDATKTHELYQIVAILSAMPTLIKSQL